MKSNSKKDARRAATIIDTAETLGLSTSEVQKVLREERNNDTVVEVFMELKERKQALVEHLKSIYNPDYSSIISFDSSN